MTLKPGMYKNGAGAVLEVLGQTWTVGNYRTLGGVWEAVTEPDIFGRTWYLVTEESMLLSGYAPIEKGERE